VGWNTAADYTLAAVLLFLPRSAVPEQVMLVVRAYKFRDRDLKEAMALAARIGGRLYTGLHADNDAGGAYLVELYPGSHAYVNITGDVYVLPPCATGSIPVVDEREWSREEQEALNERLALIGGHDMIPGEDEE